VPDDGSAWRAAPSSGATEARDDVPEAIDRAPFARDVDLRLEDAAATGRTLELVVVMRGTVHRRRGYPRPLWRVRLLDGHYRVLSSESIVAATPVKKERIPDKPVDGFIPDR
jgi:hypothetical protein